MCIYEYLEGVTLDKYVKEPSINLSHLNTDLFNGIKSLQNYGFWFADFFEKNIFCQKGGTFAFVDVDSAQRMSDLPDNAMYGSKDYWILVLKYYKEILNKTDIRLDDIHGISLNYLQIPFLVLRLKMFMNSNREEYNSPEAFNQLPSSLNEMAPGIRELFTTAITNGKRPLAAGRDQQNSGAGRE
jgi:RIO-like serine/threonine protein kinase